MKKNLKNFHKNNGKRYKNIKNIVKNLELKII